MTYLEFIEENKKIAIKNNKEDSSVIMLLSYLLDVNYSTLYKMSNDIVNKKIEEKFKELFNKYIYKNICIQYLINEQNFYGYDYYVDNRVLIPRFETELLVDNALYFVNKYFKNKKIKLLDLCAGSGCIGLTIKNENPNIDVTLCDISSDCIDVININKNKFSLDVSVVKSDLLSNINDKYDIILSNPPYIPKNEDVTSIVVDNEPHLALFADESGLYFYNEILKTVKKNLKDKFIIGFEHAYDKKKELHELIKKYFNNCIIKTYKDLNNKDRMTFIFSGDLSE